MDEQESLNVWFTSGSGLLGGCGGRKIVFEDEWIACNHPKPMLDFLEGKLSDRKLRLFACACCRRIRHLLPLPELWLAMEAAERYADGLISEKMLEGAIQRAIESFPRHYRFCLPLACQAALTALRPFRDSGKHSPLDVRTTDAAAFAATATTNRRAECQAQSQLLRDLAGNPFRPVSVDPAWLRWDNGTVLRMAGAIYEQGRFADLPILADALEEAGCADADIQGHLRGPGPHALGCWALDAVLGKS